MTATRKLTYRWGILILFVLALLWSFGMSPDDRILGSTVRIFYIHFGAAISCFVAYGVSWVAAVLYLLRRDFKYDRISAAGAEVGTLLATAVLVSGSIWARVAWNTWWTWDPRLITTAILWFIYVGYFVLRSFLEGDRRKQAVYAAVWSIFAFADVPIVYFSDRWWTSIHPVLFTGGTVNIASPAMVMAMVLFLLAMMAFMLDLLFLRSRQHAAEDRLNELKARIRADI